MAKNVDAELKQKHAIQDILIMMGIMAFILIVLLIASMLGLE